MIGVGNVRGNWSPRLRAGTGIREAAELPANWGFWDRATVDGRPVSRVNKHEKRPEPHPR